MARHGSAFLAVIDPVRLKDIIERQAAGDSLGANPQRTWGEDFDLAVAKSGASAIVFKRCEVPGILQNLDSAVPRAMLEAGERDDVWNALADGCLGPRSATNFPQAGLRLGKASWLLGSRQGQRDNG